MKDYAKRSGASLKPNRNSKVQTPFNADRWLIIFIISALILAALSASYTFYQKWRQNHVKTTITTPPSPTKTTLEKILQKSPENKQVQDTVTPKNIAKAIKKKAKTIETKTDDAKPADTEPKYDFYQILPKMTVDVQKHEDANDSSEQ